MPRNDFDLNGSSVPDPVPGDWYEEERKRAMDRLGLCVRSMLGAAKGMGVTVTCHITLRDNLTGEEYV